MSQVHWNKIKPLTNLDAVTQFESKYHVTIPDDLKNCIIEHNGGRPSPNTIKTKNGKEYDVKLLLSYNPEDKETVYKCISYFCEKKLLPFAVDSSGNYYCMCGNKVVLWVQSDETYDVSDSFSAFISGLYELS